MMALLGFYILTVNGFLKPRFTEIGFFFLFQVLFLKINVVNNAEKKKKKGKPAPQLNIKPELFTKIVFILFYSPGSNDIQ